MSAHKVSALLFLIMLVLWAVHEMGWGGGDPNEPHHNRPQWPLW
jgi:hypothetical protein